MIYTIKKGDTLFKISNTFNIPLETLIEVNGLTQPDNLAVGQNIFIPTNNPTPTNTYTIVAGDTMYNISTRLGIPLSELIKANPQIQNPNYIEVGQIINIPSNKRTIEVNGYAIANINIDTLRKTLPNLTYLSIFSYQAKPDGSLYILYEDNLIREARNAQVAPIMVVTNISEEGGFSSDLASTILNNDNLSNILINNIISTLNAKNYYGVDIDFEYIYPQDRVAYINFLSKLKERLVANNKTLSVAVAPKYRDNQQGILYEAHDYAAIGEIADRVIIMTYEWGYMYGEPMAISPLADVEAVISYAVTRIPSEKILMGMPNYAYDWILPYEQGRPATAITNTRALEIALENNADIMFDNRAQAPYFTYTNNGINHIVWFEDARSIQARISLVDKYNLAGLSYWTINNYFPVNWAVVNNTYNISKVL